MEIKKKKFFEEFLQGISNSFLFICSNFESLTKKLVITVKTKKS
jgi:hypothetical protein